MSKPIHLLLIEDPEDDVWLIVNAMRKGGYAPTYERVDKPRGEFFHTNWTGTGGDTASGSYTA